MNSAGSKTDIYQKSAIILDTNSYYLIEWHMFFDISDSTQNIYNLNLSSTIDYCIFSGLNMQCDNNINFDYVDSILGTSEILSITTTTLATGKYYHILKAHVYTKSEFSSTISLFLKNNSSTILKRGSHIKCIKLPTNNTYGAFL